jgi:hypothetical protein
MGKHYEMPVPLSLALTTERIEFLISLSDKDLRDNVSLQLIRDLIEDRIKLRAQIVKVTDALEQCRKNFNNTVGKFQNLQDYLEGNDVEEECEE